MYVAFGCDIMGLLRDGAVVQRIENAIPCIFYSLYVGVICSGAAQKASCRTKDCARRIILRVFLQNYSSCNSPNILT